MDIYQKWKEQAEIIVDATMRDPKGLRFHRINTMAVKMLGRYQPGKN